MSAAPPAGNDPVVPQGPKVPNEVLDDGVVERNARNINEGINAAAGGVGSNAASGGGGVGNNAGGGGGCVGNAVNNDDGAVAARPMAWADILSFMGGLLSCVGGAIGCLTACFGR